MPTFALLNTQTLIIVLVVALVVFGPNKLPEIGRQLGNAMRELRKMSGDMQRALDIDGHATSSYDYYNSSTYDNSASYSYDPPSETPLDQYGLEDANPVDDKVRGAGEGVSEDVESTGAVSEVAPVKPKRTRKRKSEITADPEQVEPSDATGEPAADAPEVKRTRRSRTASAVAGETTEVETDAVETKSRRRRPAKVELDQSVNVAIATGDIGGVETMVESNASGPETPDAGSETASSDGA